MVVAQLAAPCRAFVRNMDTEAVERSIQEATASVRENVSSLESALLDIEEHTRYAAPRIRFAVVTLDHSQTVNMIVSTP